MHAVLFSGEIPTYLKCFGEYLDLEVSPYNERMKQKSNVASDFLLMCDHYSFWDLGFF